MVLWLMDSVATKYLEKTGIKMGKLSEKWLIEKPKICQSNIANYDILVA